MGVVYLWALIRRGSKISLVRCFGVETFWGCLLRLGRLKELGMETGDVVDEKKGNAKSDLFGYTMGLGWSRWMIGSGGGWFVGV